MESIQLYAATLTHYSTEPLTTGPDYDPLLLLLALAGDVHPNPGPSRYPCSVCFKNVTSQGTSYLCTRCSHWVHSRCSGLRNAADYRKANGWICTACMTPFTLVLRNNRFERQSTGGCGQYFQLCSPKYRFTHKTPW